MEKVICFEGLNSRAHKAIEQCAEHHTGTSLSLLYDLGLHVRNICICKLSVTVFFNENEEQILALCDSFLNKDIEAEDINEVPEDVQEILRQE